MNQKKTFSIAIGPFAVAMVAFLAAIWVVLFAIEKLTGYESLPSWVAPARLTGQDKVDDDEIECAMYIYLIDAKAAKGITTIDEDKVLKTILNRKYEAKRNLCDMLYGMDTLIPIGTTRECSPSRKDWYFKSEFVFYTKKKTAVRERLRQLWSLGYGYKRMSDWAGVAYRRPDRGSVCNQTDEEATGLERALDPIPKAQIKLPDGNMGKDPESGFTFFKKKPE